MNELLMPVFENACDIHDSKPIFCKEWPMSPQHTAPFKNCGYRFTEIDSWEVEYEPDTA